MPEQFFSCATEPATLGALIILSGWMLLLALVRRRFYPVALLGFPGVVMHELMHLTIGVVLLAKPTSMNLMPRRVAGHWHFGSVTFTGLNLFNAAPVAYAPLLLLGAGWYSFQYWMVPLVQEQRYGAAILCGYLIACALFYSLPSVTDIKVGGLSTLFWALVAAAGWWFWTQRSLL